jgi:hypothetical protein
MPFQYTKGYLLMKDIEKSLGRPSQTLFAYHDFYEKSFYHFNTFSYVNRL